MGEAVVIEAFKVVRSKRFLDEVGEHIDGLAGYVREFLDEHRGKVNEHGREWTAELCAELLGIPSGTLHRWMRVPDQGEPAPVITPGTQRERVARSNTKAVLRDPVQRRAALQALPSEVRDELRADLLDIDIPHDTTRCFHCPNHCPKGDA